MKHKAKIFIVLCMLALGVALLIVSRSSFTSGAPEVTIVDQGVNMSKSPETKTITKEQDGHIDMK